jgi:hypothetical protein
MRAEDWEKKPKISQKEKSGELSGIPGGLRTAVARQREEKGSRKP